MVTRVLYVENGMHGGGSAESLLQLINALDKAQYEPHVLLTSDIPVKDRLLTMGVPTVVAKSICFSRPESLFASIVFKLCSGINAYLGGSLCRLTSVTENISTSVLQMYLKKLVRTKKIDVVHTNNNAHRDYWAIKAASEAGVPCVVHLRSFHAMGFGRCKAKKINVMASAMIGYSQSILDFWQGKGLEVEKLNLIYNAISQVQNDPADLVAEFDLSKDTPVIGIVGRVIDERGHDFLLKAIPAVLDKVPDLKLIIVGGADEREKAQLQDLVAELGIDDAVIWAGHRSNGKAIIAALNAIVLPYTIEPFGRTLLEAWRLGTPVVLSRVGHIEKIVEHNRNALLFDREKPEALAEQLIRVFLEPDLANKLVSEGKVECEARFSVVAQAASVQTLYESVLHPSTLNS